MLMAPLLLIVISLTVYPNLIESMKQSVALSLLVPKMLDIYGFNSTLFLVLMVQSTMAADIFVAEKTRKSIEVTLTAPVSPGDVLMGKVAAIFAVGYPVSVASFLLIAATLWAEYGFYLPSIYTLLYVAILLPALSILLLISLGMLQLSTRHYAVATAALVLVMWLTIFVPSFFMEQMPGAQNMFLLYGLTTAILAAIIGLYGKKLLSKEKIVTTAS
jgi:ABC-type Na+ efflux pump permease subunit